MRGGLKEAEEGRQKAEVDEAQLRVEVEALRRTGDDLQHAWGWLGRRCAASPPPSVPPSPPIRGRVWGASLEGVRKTPLSSALFA